MTASAAPISIASRTDVTASRTSDAWSYTALSRTPGGSVRRESPRMTPATLSAIATVLPPICRVMLSSAAGLPSPATMRDVILRARHHASRDRARDATPRPVTTTFAMSSGANAPRCVGHDQVLLVVLRQATDRID